MADRQPATSNQQPGKNQVKYNPSTIEPYWQSVWENEKTYQPDLDTATSTLVHSEVHHELLSTSSPFYNLNMFPYPSAEGLHVGNMYAFTGGDIYGRFHRMNGRHVFQPIGLDGFGIHSENYALKVGSHPMEQAATSEKNFYRQLHSIGNGYDWTRTVETWKPDYYKWTQWVFIELFKAGLAYRAAAEVNWCPSCKTVLADEQVIDARPPATGAAGEVGRGKCERCSTEVEKRDLEQWFFRITGYSERLLQDLDKIDWTEKVKIAQRNWIGKSEGALVKFSVLGSQFSERGLSDAQLSDQPKTDKQDSENRNLKTENNNFLEVFTTRPDTLHGATFMVVSPEHSIVSEILNQVQDDKVKGEVQAYVEQAKGKSDKERRDEGKAKTGVFSGAYAVNPVNNQQIPIWIADYVLMGYGTGAIMAVPAHDQRDFEFAKKYNLPIIPVIEPKFVARQGDSAVKEGQEFVKREAVCAIVRDPKTDKYLCISWKQFSMNGLVTGGLEEGEDPVEAARREVQEETGYKNVRFVEDPGIYIHSLFYHRQKQQNRYARFHFLFFELENEERDSIDSNEAKLSEAIWKSREELAEFFTVIEGEYLVEMLNNPNRAYIGEGVLANSGEWNGWETPEAKRLATEWLEKNNMGQKETNYHLRDWLISRQRYWGAPIPMIYCEKCAGEGKSWFTTDEGKERVSGISYLVSVKDEKEQNTKYKIQNTDASGWYPAEDLPVELPKIDDYRPLGTGKAPLANHPEFYETTCPACGSPARRETDVADTFLDSSWYFLRYLATDLANIPFPMGKESAEGVIASGAKQSPKKILNQVQDDKNGESNQIRNLKLEISNSAKRSAWLPVNQYIGGAEHSVLHLLYARFVYKVFTDLGYIESSSGGEPFPKFFAHGLIIKEGAKMSKSKGNVVVPDLYIKKYGADTLRTYLMFLGPFSEGGDFQDSGIAGINKFLKRVWTLMIKQIEEQGMEPRGTNSPNHAEAAFMHRTIKGVTEDISKFRYNTAIAKLMTWYNALAQRESLTNEEVETYLKLLAPFAPHMTEELWQRLRFSVFRFQSSDKSQSDDQLSDQPNTEKQDSENRNLKTENFISIHTSKWPEFDAAFLIDQNVTIAIQVNGKLRDTLTLQRVEGIEQRVVEELAKKSEKVKKFIEGKEIKKAVYVPGKVLNLVI